MALALAVAMVAPATASAAPSPGGPGLGEPFEIYKWQGNGGYDVQNYDIDLTYQPSTDHLAGRAVITAQATKELSEFNLDFWLKVSSVKVNGVEASYRTMTEDQTELVVTPKTPILGGTFQVEVVYSGTPSEAGQGVERVRWSRSGPKDLSLPRTGGLSVNQPRTAEWWYPVNDHPSDKATYSVSVNVPKDYVAISNGHYLSTKDDGPGRVRWSWWSREPMAPYLAYVAIERFQYETGTARISGRDVPYFRAYDPNLESFGLMPTAKKVLESSDQITDFLASQFGPYPFDTTGGVASSGIPFAIENQSRSTYGTIAMAAGDYGQDETWVTAHEQAHQWFGDSVSIGNWKQMWLNESFATYAEWLWSEHRGGPTADKLANAYYNRDWAAAPWSDPTFWNNSVADPDGIFGYPVYYRGAMGLHALRKKIGDAKFFLLLKRYHSEHKYQNAFTTDFTALAEEIGGPGVREVFDTWIYSETKPATSPAGLAVTVDAKTVRQAAAMTRVHDALIAAGHGDHGHGAEAPDAQAPK
ncbi:M1 family metallopeptidase [Kribbella sp. NPDC005582]|uniref:M1 family metallopeptidase n=1 Tax=Kribbella sp. NPDC005582 TaxID=3156893 RepID=UPI00339E59B9